jgi:hypothetical protein
MAFFPYEAMRLTQKNAIGKLDEVIVLKLLKRSLCQIYLWHFLPNLKGEKRLSGQTKH